MLFKNSTSGAVKRKSVRECKEVREIWVIPPPAILPLSIMLNIQVKGGQIDGANTI
jgi:hypothetical protein